MKKNILILISLLLTGCYTQLKTIQSYQMREYRYNDSEITYQDEEFYEETVQDIPVFVDFNVMSTWNRFDNRFYWVDPYWGDPFFDPFLWDPYWGYYRGWGSFYSNPFLFGYRGFSYTPIYGWGFGWGNPWVVGPPLVVVAGGRDNNNVWSYGPRNFGPGSSYSAIRRPRTTSGNRLRSVTRPRNTGYDSGSSTRSSRSSGYSSGSRKPRGSRSSSVKRAPKRGSRSSSVNKSRPSRSKSKANSGSRSRRSSKKQISSYNSPSSSNAINSNTSLRKSTKSIQSKSRSSSRTKSKAKSSNSSKRKSRTRN